jgi:putative flippase GtrA
MVKPATVDVGEFARFFLVGITATVGNIAAVWLTRFFVSYQIALLAGIAAGAALSFVLSKLFAFDSRSWKRAGGEAVRFLVVYSVGCVVYWGVAVMCSGFLLSQGVAPQIAEVGGALVGAGTMLLTSYFGHRFITYRTYQRATEGLDPAS